jgi:hypothetical protein
LTPSIALRVAALLALVQGAYMLADGVHFLTSGAYFGNGVGPWASLVARTGLDPSSRTMAAVFVVFGALWLASAAALARATARYAVVVLAVLTLWYLPVGTVLSAIVLLVAARAPAGDRARG